MCAVRSERIRTCRPSANDDKVQVRITFFQIASHFFQKCISLTKKRSIRGLFSNRKLEKKTIFLHFVRNKYINNQLKCDFPNRKKSLKICV